MSTEENTIADPFENYEGLEEYKEDQEDTVESKKSDELIKAAKERVYEPVLDKSGGKNYLSNKELLAEVVRCKEAGKMSDRLARMLMLLSERYSRRSNFIGYSYREDMVSEALLNLCKNALKFNPEKSNNPFAYYTRAIHCSFLQYMAGEKKEHYIRDVLLIEEGEEASHGFADNIVKRQLDDEVSKKKDKDKQPTQTRKERESFYRYEE